MMRYIYNYTEAVRFEEFKMVTGWLKVNKRTKGIELWYPMTFPKGDNYEVHPVKLSHHACMKAIARSILFAWTIPNERVDLLR